MATHVDLLRHGAVAGAPGFWGARDIPLAPAGWRAMADAVAGRGPWDVVISSPLRRCLAFARTVTPPPLVEPRLREMGFGDWEGRTAAELMATDPAALTRFWADPVHATPPGGEPLPEVRDRVLAAWGELLTRHAGQRLLLVTHGGPIRILLAHLQGLPLARVLEVEAPLAGLFTLELPGVTP